MSDVFPGMNRPYISIAMMCSKYNSHDIVSQFLCTTYILFRDGLHVLLCMVMYQIPLGYVCVTFGMHWQTQCIHVGAVLR